MHTPKQTSIFHSPVWRAPRLLWILLAGAAVAASVSVQAQDDSMVTGTDFKILGANLLPDRIAWRGDRGDWTQTGAGEYVLQAPGTGIANFRVNVAPEADGEYLFTARIRSNGRVVVYLGGLSMSYHDQGEWQLVSGLVRGAARNANELRFDVRSLDGKPVTVFMQNPELVKVERPPSVVSRPRDGKTPIVINGRPNAVIVHPTADAHGGLRIQAEIEATTGVRLPLVADTVATEEKWPVLKPEYRDTHLIITGRLATNRALWASYNRFLSAVDGYYPGGDGHVVRTAANVFGNGKNHLIAGGSTDVGVQRAVDRLLSLIRDKAVREGGGLTVPWLLDVELGGECAVNFARDGERWANPENAGLAAMTSGYGKVTRWYENVMGYYWSGGDAYLDRAQSYLRMILEERAKTHHYIVEFFIRTYNMISDSPVLSKQQVEELDALVLENFLDFLTLTELSWMTVFSPPYENISIRNRHQIAPWYSDLVMARFLLKNVRLEGRLKALVAFRESEKKAAFDHFVATRNAPSLPGIAAASDYEEIPASFFRYALEDEHYDGFFGSGLAEQALALDRLNPDTGRLALPVVYMDIGMWLGALAHLTGDGRYQWIIDNVHIAENPRGPFQKRYVAKTHRYQTGGEIEAENPGGKYSGISVGPQPHLWQQVPEISHERFPHVAIRGGLAAEDDFILIAGVTPSLAPGVLVRMVVDGMTILGGGRIEGGDSRLTANSADALRLDDLRPLLFESPAEDARISWLGEFPNAWGVGIDTPLSPFVDWNRSVLRLHKGLYVFIDTFTAKSIGDYLLRTSWQPAGGLRRAEKGWEVYSSKGSALFSSSGEGFASRKLHDSLVDEAVLSLADGDSATLWTLVQKGNGSTYPWDVVSATDNQLTITCSGGNEYVIHRGPISLGDATLEASVIVANEDGYAVFGIEDEEAIPLPSFYLAHEKNHPMPSDWEPAFSPELLRGFLHRQLPDAAEQPTVRVAESIRIPRIIDHSSHWSEQWTYNGLKRPVEVSPRHIDATTVDFGEEISLAEIRSRPTVPRIWRASSLPERIQVSPPGMQRPPEDGEWIELDFESVARSGTRTGNYGESTPVDKADAAAFFEGLITRYVRAEGAPELKYFIHDKQRSRHPVGLEWIPDDEGSGLILATNASFPQFPRPMRDDDVALALLEPDGRPMTELEFNGPVQTIRVADQNLDGSPEIFVLKADARLEHYGLDGDYLGVVDMHAQHEEFNHKHGRSNTRHPAGGHRMPFSMGFWRQGDFGRKLYVSRYGSMAFHDDKFDLEGVLSVSGYALSGALAEGFDFSGDGLEETMVIARFSLMHFGGSSTSRIREPGGRRFWPEVYEPLAIVRLDGSGSRLLGGPPVYEFRRLETFGGQGNYVIVARGDFIGIYDGAGREFDFSWSPADPITAATVLHESADKLTVGFTTVDGLLWRMNFKPQRLSHPTLSVQPLNLWVHALGSLANNDGAVFICAEEGLFRYLEGGDLELIRAGSWLDALSLLGTGIVAVDAEGGIQKLIKLDNIK